MIYDLDRCPPTFDAVSAAMRFERERIERGAESFTVDVLHGSDRGFARNTLWPQGTAARTMARDRIALPLLRMNPACEAVILRERSERDPRPEYICHFGEFLKTYGRGVRPLRPLYDVPPAPALVTMTLRECEHWPQRNSATGEWIKAAREIAAAGWQVVIVRDTARAGDPIPGFGIDAFQSASINLELRAALYRSAFCNMFVNNGPAWLAFALDAPAVVLKVATEGASHSHGAQHWRRLGVRPGADQLPGAPPHQRLCWREDTADSIVQAFVEFHAINGARGHEGAVH